MNVPSWDLFITLFFIVAIGFGFILQRDKVVTTLLSIYAGIVVSEVISEPMRLFFAGDKTLGDQVWVRANTSPFTIQTALFVITIVVVSAKSGLAGKNSKGILSPLELMGYSFFNAALILASIFSFMDPAQKQIFIETSRFANMIVSHHTFWIIAPIVLMVATGGLHRTSSSSYN